MKKILFLAVLFLALYSCKKDNNDDQGPMPPGDDTTEFVIPATSDMVMYEVNIRAFSNTGDLQGVINRLGEIRKLGINVIWLMPIHPIGEVNTVNSPYCVRNYKEVNPEFGTLGDLQTLVDEAHQKGMAVILDWVANHTAWDNPWISNKDWYTQDNSGNIIHPPGTNWQDVADLNYDNQEMRQAMIEAMKYWIGAAGIDGFRCDAADFIPFDFWSQALTSVNASTEKNLIWLAEGARDDHFTAGFEMNYGWSFYNKIKDVFMNYHSAAGLVPLHQQDYQNIPDGKQVLRFTTNHDESAWDATPVILFGGTGGALAASVITFYLGGVPLLYGSQEVGVASNIPFFESSPINWSQNPDMLESYRDILGYYASSEVLKQNTVTSYSDNNVVAFKKESDQTDILVIVNVRDELTNFTSGPDLQDTEWENVFSGDSFTLPATMNLEPFEYMVLQR